MSTTEDVQVPEWLGRLSAGDQRSLELLRVELARRAERDGLLELAYRTLDTPVGTLLLAATEQGLVRVAFEREGLDRVLAALASSVSPRILQAPARLDAVAGQLDQYFSQDRRVFDVPLDFRLARGFRLEVLAQLSAIGYGHTLSYTEVARAAGSAKAVRAVGTACATNPLPVVVPCHRVLRSDGSLGGYLGGLDAKRTLLRLESGDPAAAADKV
ncbi:MAG TPA: methylated-DNA--[protein]-cysteine S-methyltransferase [Propionibacteriaceae bacterium]